MKQIAITATAALTAAAIPVTSAFAATSGELEGRMRIPYACSVETPPVLELIPINGIPNVAVASDSWSFSHNDDTTYTLDSLNILASNSNAKLNGSITLTDGTSPMLEQESETVSVSTEFTVSLGNYASVARDTIGAPQVTIELSETVADVFWAGDYRIVSTISCGQNTTRGFLFE